MNTLKVLYGFMFALMMLMASQETATAQPQGKFGVAWVQNNLSGPITFYYKWQWPNGQVASDWKVMTLEPGKRYYLSWRYDGANAASPDLFVRFDTDRNNGALYWEYKLGRGQSPDAHDANFGAHYSIDYVNQRKEFAELRNANSQAKSWIMDRKSSAP